MTKIGQININNLYKANEVALLKNNNTTILDAMQSGVAVEKIAPVQEVSSPVAPLLSYETMSSLLDIQEIAGVTKSSEDKKIEDNFSAKAFLDYMSKSPEERVREQILSSMNLTEEELADIPPEERKAIEDKIAEIIKEKVERTVKNTEDLDAKIFKV